MLDWFILSYIDSQSMLLLCYTSPSSLSLTILHFIRLSKLFIFSDTLLFLSLSLERKSLYRFFYRRIFLCMYFMCGLLWRMRLVSLAFLELHCQKKNEDQINYEKEFLEEFNILNLLKESEDITAISEYKVL